MKFDDFVAERLDPLLRYATLLCHDPHQAKDLVQDVLLRAQQRWPRISGLDAPAAYVKRMVTNEFLSWRRRIGRRGEVGLRYFEDCSDAEIAEALGCRPGTVRSLLSRGLAALRVRSHALEPALTAKEN